MGTGKHFVFIPLPSRFRGLGFRLMLAETRPTARCSRRGEENPSAETAQHGANALGGRKGDVGRP